MVVEACDNGHVGSNDQPYTSQQFTIAIIDVFGNHRPMQVEVHAVEVAGTLQIFQQQRRDVFVRSPRYPPRWLCRAPRQRQQFMMQLTSFGNKASGGQVDALDSVKQGGSAHEAWPRIGRLEIEQRCRVRRKRIGLVLNPPTAIRAISGAIRSNNPGT